MTGTADGETRTEYVAADARTAYALTECAAAWLPGIEGLVRSGTVAAYARRLELHVLPRLGSRRLDEIGVDNVAELIADLHRRGYSGATISCVLVPADPAHRTLLVTPILSGLRQGEFLGLHWEDINFARRVIHVRMALDRQRREAPPKTRMRCARSS